MLHQTNRESGVSVSGGSILTVVVQRVLCVVNGDLLLVVGPLGRVEVHHLTPVLQDLHWELSIAPLVHPSSDEEGGREERGGRERGLGERGEGVGRKKGKGNQ